ncbi:MULTISPECIES: hypothetical protein [unclassified Methanoculleus]|jgi:hypothetical protein|uniref:hypothetical protein n=1 Tax=unclassified Methanoculleus TaxID=2619537 RepID=UPI0025E16010|nr:hypothetical protein [Methanoculleus sp. UBA377]
MKKGKGVLSVLAVLMLFVSVSVGAVFAAQIDVETPVEKITDDMGILETIDLGSMSTDGDGDTAYAVGVGPVTVSAGYNTFTASYSNKNDRPLDGQGAVYRLTVWDARGVAHPSDDLKVDAAGSGTISVSFDSRGSGDAQYELWCRTHDWLETEMDSSRYTEDLDYV